VQRHTAERNTLLNGQIRFFQLMTMINSHELDFRFMEVLMHILTILSGIIWVFSIELQF